MLPANHTSILDTLSASTFRNLVVELCSRVLGGCLARRWKTGVGAILLNQGTRLHAKFRESYHKDVNTAVSFIARRIFAKRPHIYRHLFPQFSLMGVNC